MKKKYWLIIPLFLLALSSCTARHNTDTVDEEETETEQSDISASDKLMLYSSLLDDIENKGLEASTSEYYKTNFSYSVSYLSGRTNYNLVSLDRTCKIRNDSLYVLKTTSYQTRTLNYDEEKTIYVKENEDIYSYTFEGNATTLDTAETLPVYSVAKEANFDIQDVAGFSQSIITSEGFDGTNGIITKTDSVYEIKMNYATVKEESLVKFIINLGYFSNMTAYISEEDLMVDFRYTFSDSGYNLEYGFSYDTDSTTITASVNLGIFKEEAFDIVDFSNQNTYIKRYPQSFEAVTDTHNVGEVVSGRYSDYSLFKFYLKPGYYNVTSNGKALGSNDYSIYDDNKLKLSKYSLTLDKLSVGTNYFEVKEEGYYYIYLEISNSLKDFKLEEIKYNTYGDKTIKTLEEVNEGILEGLCDYEPFTFTTDSNLTIKVTNNSNHSIRFILPVGFLSNYSYKDIAANESYSFSLRKGTYYIIVCPEYANDGLDYSFTISSESAL